MMTGIQAQADAAIDKALDLELAAAMRRTLTRLSKAQALAWNLLNRHEQMAFLEAVDRLEARPSPSAGSVEQQRRNDMAQGVTL